MATTSMAIAPLLSTRGSQGVQLFRGPRFEPVTEFAAETSKSCRVTAWSPDGKYFAWVNGSSVRVVNTTDWQLVADFPRPKTSGLQFSPKGTYLATWEPYAVTKDTPQNTPNLHIWSLQSKESVKSYVQKKHSGWEPVWTRDEKLLARNLNLEVQVYETDKLESMAHKMADMKIADFSISPGHAPYFFLCYIPGTKGQPSFAKLFRYPQLQQSGVISNKSFFQGDRVEMKWNKAGTSVLLLTSTDVDTSGASYYGKQTLHYLDTKGNSAMVQLAKEGPIYSVEWNPKGNEFCVVYGFMPAKATLFDLKCEPKFDFGTGPRNSVYYNPFGNVLLLGGFGNLRGKIEVWDVKAMKMICPMEAPDSTHLQWSSDGQHFLTCTTAPRLRVGNGVKIWHYSGSLLHEHLIPSPNELWESTWQPLPESLFKEFNVSSKKVEGIQSSQPQVSKEIYRPPGARGSNFAPILKLLDEREPPSNPKGSTKEVGKNAAKNKKKREQRRLKKEEGAPEEKAAEEAAKPVKVSVNVASDVEIKLTGNQEIDKQLKDLKKKLDQIAKLKAEQEAGRILELNQKDKIAKEDEFRKQLQKLSLQN